MKVGDLIKLPGDNGFAIVLKIVITKASRSVMVLSPWDEDWWDANACELINEQTRA